MELNEIYYIGGFSIAYNTGNIHIKTYNSAFQEVCY